MTLARASRSVIYALVREVTRIRSLIQIRPMACNLIALLVRIIIMMYAWNFCCTYSIGTTVQQRSDSFRPSSESTVLSLMVFRRQVGVYLDLLAHIVLASGESGVSSTYVLLSVEVKWSIITPSQLPSRFQKKEFKQGDGLVCHSGLT